MTIRSAPCSPPVRSQPSRGPRCPPGTPPASSAASAHPLGRLDHLLAMLAVGLFAARQAGAARLLLPAGFVLAMLAGAGSGARPRPAGWSRPAFRLGAGAC